jgi:uncharacterized protein (TIGR02118 family)
MVKISIFYPNSKGARFDVRYYIDTHMPLSIKLLSAHPGFRSVSVEHGLGGAAPGTELAFIAMCHFAFESMDAFMEAFTPHAPLLQGDMPNYTDITPIIQVSDVVISKSTVTPVTSGEL